MTDRAPLRVAIDGRRLQDRPPTGVGRVLANLVPLLASHVEVVLLTDSRRPPAPCDLRQVALGAPPEAPEPVWLHLSAGRWLRRFDGVFHGTFNALPACRSARGVVTFYDLSWEVHPEDFRLDKRVLWMAQARWSARRAAVITTISDHARRTIIDTYKVPAGNVVIARPAVDPIFRPEAAQRLPAVLARLGVPRPYVIAMGGARRRGLEVAVGAWERLDPAWRPALVVVGTSSGARARPLPRGVFDVGRVDDETWATLLAGAEALCYPTRFEGYGMPALEAAASGTPVVCAPVGPLPEVLGHAACWCNAPTIPAIAAGLRALLDSSEDRREALRRAGLERVRNAPGWEAAADVLLGAYERAAA